MNGIIYKIVNRINGKLYVGQTIKTLDQRLRGHLRSAYNTRSICGIHCAIRKYGIQSFECSVIDEAFDQVVLDEKERYWIRALGSLGPNGYNMTPGGERVHFTDKIKQKMSLNHPRPMLGRKASLETRKKQSAATRGIPKPPRTAGHHKNLSIAQKARFQREPVSEARRKLASLIHKGRKKSASEIENSRRSRVLVWNKWREESSSLGITIPQLWELNRSAVQ